MYLGAFIEGVATLMCRLASRAIGDFGPRFATIYDSFVGTSLVVAGGELVNVFYVFICWLLICISYISSFQFFGRLLKSGSGNSIEMGLSWPYQFRAYHRLLVGCLCRCPSLCATVQDPNRAHMVVR